MSQKREITRGCRQADARGSASTKALAVLFVCCVVTIAISAWIIFTPYESDLDSDLGDSSWLETLEETLESKAEKTDLIESFEGPAIDDALWQVTREGEFEKSTVDIVNHRLRLRMATVGARDKTVKHHGLRSQQAFDLSQGGEISFALDWNDPANGSDLTAGVYVCPTPTDKSPRDLENWLKFEFVGVSPGKNARRLLAARQDGLLQNLFTEERPPDQKTGRTLGGLTVRLAIREKRIRVLENGALLCECDLPPLDFSKVYLYLQMSSHGNYGAREVFFDDVMVTKEPR